MHILPPLRNRLSGFARSAFAISFRRALSLCNVCCAAILIFGSCGLSRPAHAEQPSEVVATFTGGEITRDDLQAVITQKLPYERERLQREGAVHDVLESLIRYDLLVQDAKARGYGDDLRVRDAAKAKANDLLIQQLAAVDPDAISAEEIAKAFAERKQDFSRPRMRRASHILVPTREQAMALIAELRGADRTRFARAASEHSQDPSTRNQGGELGYFARDGQTERGVASAAPAPLVAAAFELRGVGDITPQPVPVEGGFSVLMLTGEMPSFETPRAQVEEHIREQLLKTRSEAKLDGLVAELQAQYKPVVHAELVDLVQMPQPEPTQIPAGFPAAPPDPREPPKVVEPDGI